MECHAVHGPRETQFEVSQEEMYDFNGNWNGVTVVYDISGMLNKHV